MLATASPGDSQTVDKTFPVDPAWVVSNLHAIAFIQEEGPNTTWFDDPIWQACSDHAPQYSVTYYPAGDRNRVAIVPLSTAHSFGDIVMYNAGTGADTFTVRLAADRAPTGWIAEFTDGTNTYANQVQLPLNAGETKTFHVNVTPTNLDYGKYRLEMSSNNLPANVKAVNYTVIADGVCVLVVDDDGGATYEQYYSAALDTTGYSYAIWPYMDATVSASVMQKFKAVLWYTAAEYPTLSDTDRTELASFLNGGGKLFINGQDIGWELARPADIPNNDPGGTDPTFYKGYLHATYVADDSGARTLTGVAGDPIGDGLSFCIFCGDAANYTPYPDSIWPFDPFASNFVMYGAGASGGIKADTGTNKVVYLGIGFETIGDATSRATLMKRAIDWLGGCQSSGDCPNGTPSKVALTMSKPNATDLQFNWPSDTNAVGGFDLYSTDDATIVTRLRKENSYTPVTTFPAGTVSGTLPMAGGLTYYQMVAACNNNVEGPN
jgi:hypothetical protein